MGQKWIILFLVFHRISMVVAWFVGRLCTSKTVVCARQSRSSVHVIWSGVAASLLFFIISHSVVCARRHVLTSRSSVHVAGSGFATCHSSFRHHQLRHHYPQHHLFRSIFCNIISVLFLSLSKFIIQLIFCFNIITFNIILFLSFSSSQHHHSQP